MNTGNWSLKDKTAHFWASRWPDTGEIVIGRWEGKVKRATLLTTGKPVRDVQVRRDDQGGVALAFRPVDGPGLYHLYDGAHEDILFAPDQEWLRDLCAAVAVDAIPLRIEARCAIDDFDADDGDHHQQFNQGEAGALPAAPRPAAAAAWAIIPAQVASATPT